MLSVSPSVVVNCIFRVSSPENIFHVTLVLLILFFLLLVPPIFLMFTSTSCLDPSPLLPKFSLSLPSPLFSPPGLLTFPSSFVSSFFFFLIYIYSLTSSSNPLPCSTIHWSQLESSPFCPLSMCFWAHLLEGLVMRQPILWTLLKLYQI